MKTLGRVSDLLRRIPYLMSGGIIPPVHVVNEVLRKGEYDAGMSGKVTWKPIELTCEEHKEVVEELEQIDDGSKTFLYEEPPEWVLSRFEWSVWVQHLLQGVPIEENLRLQRQMAELDELMRDAAGRGDEDARVKYLCQLSEASMQWSEFINAHRNIA